VNKNLKRLEEESISIIRNTLSEAENPVVLYSVGKDSSVLLHLFRKSFYPAEIPVKFLHIDTGWKFSEMITFRDKIIKKYNLNFEVFTNLEGQKKDVNPFNNSKYTDIMKTKALKDALSIGQYDFIYGGARRDEEASRSKEKIVSHRDSKNNWNPTNQRIEPWNIFNVQKLTGESFRVFPLSNWTEINIWQYIKQEKIEIVDLYFSKLRSVVKRENQYFLLDDDRFEIQDDDKVFKEKVRFRTLGCYPLTAGVKSNADTLTKVISEVYSSNYSERSGRLIDFDKLGSMEMKKREGYF